MIISKFKPLCAVGVALFLMGYSLDVRGEISGPIEALAGDSVYMSLVKRSEVLEIRKDSLLTVVDDCREAVESGEAGSKETLVDAEFALIDLQVAINDVKSQVGAIVAKWELGNLDLSAGDVAESEGAAVVDDVEIGGESVATICNSRVVKAKLSEDNYEVLVDSERDEKSVSTLYQTYLDGYHRLRNLQQLYNQTSSEVEALKYMEQFRALEGESVKVMRQLDRRWADLYDDKTFVYTLLLEHLACDEHLARGESILREGAAKVALLEEGVSQIVGGYEYNKRALLNYEQVVAEALQLTAARDSLRGALRSVRVSSVGGDELAEVEIEERNFIEYDDIKFSSSPIYKAGNPIPVAKSYAKGAIYRIQVGAFKSQQQPSIFRGAYPVSYDKAFGYWTYYIGGYSTMSEALRGQALCKSRGFRRPEIVRWSDGKRRNLGREPLPQTKGFRVQLDGAEDIPEGVKSLIDRMGGSVKIVRVGGDKYMVGTIANNILADELAEAINRESEELTATVVAIE